MGVADVLLGRLADGELVIIDGGSHRKMAGGRLRVYGRWAASRIWPAGCARPPHSNGSPAVTACIRWLWAGPSAQHVTVPGLT
jgi:hypothetical protein